MPNHTEAWNAGYEAAPADTEALSQGADRIRDLKLALRERLVAGGHAMSDGLTTGSNDGRHAVNIDGSGKWPVYKADKTTLAFYVTDTAVSAATGVSYLDAAGRIVGVRERAIVWPLTGALVSGSADFVPVEVPSESSVTANVKALRLLCRNAPASSTVTVAIMSSTSGMTTPTYATTVITNIVAAGSNRGNTTGTISVTQLNRWDVLIPLVSGVGGTTPGTDMAIMLILEF